MAYDEVARVAGSLREAWNPRACSTHAEFHFLLHPALLDDVFELIVHG
jgi:hypothetical protein